MANCLWEEQRLSREAVLLWVVSRFTLDNPHDRLMHGVWPFVSAFAKSCYEGQHAVVDTVWDFGETMTLKDSKEPV